MDFGPGKKIHRQNDRYWVWDYESDKMNHTLGLSPDQVRNIEVLDDQFDPGEFVRWSPAWVIPRDWGQYS